MITPEIISYIRSQLAAGVSREALMSSLSRQIKDGQFSADYIIVSRDGRLIQTLKTIDLSSYKGTDMMNGSSIDQLISQYPNASYSDVRFSYQK